MVLIGARPVLLRSQVRRNASYPPARGEARLVFPQASTTNGSGKTRPVRHRGGRSSRRWTSAPCRADAPNVRRFAERRSGPGL